MINKEQLKKDIKVVSQNAWKSDVNTTLNLMVEELCREIIFLVIDAFEARIKELENANEIRGLQELQGDQESEIKVRKSRAPKSRESSLIQ
jgi:hypothetical protein